MNLPKKILTSFESFIIEHKGTEPAFSGEYNTTQDTGVYLCKRCERPLFRSQEKFVSHCGWPSFDGEISGAIKRVPDADGSRTEIVCAHCDAHLGHVFLGEGYTVKNLRHCVNSASLIFQKQSDLKTERAVFASGCFWGTEYHFSKALGVVQTRVGYSGGSVKNPTYEMVCSHNTGHLEAVEVIYSIEQTTYENLVKLFFETHDFSQENGQGPDIGSQYLSAVFTQNAEQRIIVERVIGILKGKGYHVATKVLGEAPFYEGEKYHQKYYSNNGKTPYCHVYRSIF